MAYVKQLPISGLHRGLDLEKVLFKNLFFGVTCCPYWLSLLFSFFFCHQVVHLIHLVFRWTWELNPRPRTMAQTVSPWRSPLDQGASPWRKCFTDKNQLTLFTKDILSKERDSFFESTLLLKQNNNYSYSSWMFYNYGT